MKTYYFFLIFLLFSLINQSTSAEEKKPKSKPKKKKKNPKNKDNLMDNGLPTPDSIRPSHVSPELLCDSCQAIISEAVKRLGKQTKSSEVLFYLDKVCDPQRYNIYHFPPPDMKTGCEVFVGAYNDEVERVLIGRKLDLSTDDLIHGEDEVVVEIGLHQFLLGLVPGPDGFAVGAVDDDGIAFQPVLRGRGFSLEDGLYVVGGQVHLMATPLDQFAQVDVEIGDVALLALQDEFPPAGDNLQVRVIGAELRKDLVAGPIQVNGVDGFQGEGFFHIVRSGFPSCGGSPQGRSSTPGAG